MEDLVKSEVTEGIARLILNRPKVFNAFDLDMVHSLSQRLIELALDKLVSCVIITGQGKAFCAGADLRWVSGFEKTHGEVFHEMVAHYHQAIIEIRRMPKPVIAAINGVAAGAGFSIALACDIRIIERSSILKLAYTTNGLSIDGGGTYSLPRFIGLARAMEIATFDRPISSEKALLWGLVTEVVEDMQSLKRAIELSKEIRRTIPLHSFAASKKLMSDSFDTSFEAQLEKERDSLSACADDPNGREGIAAFVERRPPNYS